MIVENINKNALRPRVLVVPLDWGLGHATRCIPIINVLYEHNIEVLIGAEGAVAKLLQNEFPSIVILPLKGYRIRYSRHRGLFFLKMIQQFPAVLAAIMHEKNWLKKTIIDYGIDAVISDNRFGLSDPKTPCVYVTHQLFIETGNGLLNRIAQMIHYRFINKYNECWVPDVEGVNNLAGKLSQPHSLPKKPVKYLGILSRFKKIITGKKIDLLILLSGPEPKRSIFENILLSQLKDTEGSIALVRGLPVAENKISPAKKNLVIYDHLPAQALSEIIQQSDIVLARAGYSTIMDLATLKQKAILVPTPGQTEQEYLATYLMEKKLFMSSQQENFSLQQLLETARHFNYTAAENLGGINENIIIDWINSWKNKITVLQ